MNALNNACKRKPQSGTVLLALLASLVWVQAVPRPAPGDDAGETKGKGKAEEVREEPKEAVGKESWPQFRGGPHLRGYRKMKTAISDSPRLLWAYDTGTLLESSAAIADGVTYVGTGDGELLALDLLATGKDGKLLWKYSTEEKIGIRSSPGVHGGIVYFGDDAGYFYAVDGRNGKKVWQFDTEGGAEIISSANFAGDRVLFGSYDGHLFCLVAKTGKLVWKYLTGGPVHSTPALIDGKTFVAGCDELLRVVDVESGKQVLEMEMGAYSAASPAVTGGRLFVGTFANEVIGVDWRRGRRLWTYTHPKKSFPFYSSPAVAADRLVVGGRDKMVHAVDTESGKSLWTFATKGRVESSPLIAGERVVCGSSDSNLYMLDLKTGSKVWSFAADGAFVASPALGQGRLVIGADNGLIYCFDVLRRRQTGTR